ncbi:MAG: hypothetical protein KDK97_16645, partial [Verrucomicrobiales bacterium]|nr:hypothetical protein [Verrucomicrobiales bacterium]
MLRLGASVDAESTAPTNSSANGDDGLGGNDEDGVLMPTSLTPGSVVVIPVSVYNNTGSNAYLTAWIDFNNDGILSDALVSAGGERLALELTTPSNGSQTNYDISFTVPYGLTAGTARGARFRLSNAPNQASIGAGCLGEVEDYVVSINAPASDMGDFSGFPDAASAMVTTLRLGDLIDVESVSTRNSTATGDDQSNLDDEDGVSVPTTMEIAGNSEIIVTTTNMTGAMAYLNVWIDFNGDGVLVAGERVAADTLITSGGASVVKTIPVTVPSNVLPGTVGVRARLTSVANPGPDGMDGNGEVEDYVTTLVCGTMFVVPASLPDGRQGTPYSETLSVWGGVAPYTYQLTSGALPAGLTLSTGGVVSGTPSNPSTTVYEITATDVNGCSTLMSGSITVHLLSPIGIGNQVFIDSNENGIDDVGEGVAGVTVELYGYNQTPGVSAPLRVVTTGSDGGYFFEALDAGTYIVHIPATEFGVGHPLYSLVSIQEGLAGDDDVGEDGINVEDASLSGISSGFVSVGLGYAPTELTGETGIGSDGDDDVDAAVDLTVDFGFQSPVGIGNLVFVDQDNNGVFDMGEGVEGVTVELYQSDQIPGVDQAIRVTQTDIDGKYYFGYLPSGSYQVFIPASEFGIGGLLEGMFSLPGATANGDDDVGENGIDEAVPSITGIRSAAVTLAGDQAPVNGSGETGGFATMDDSDDNNGDLTIDFGFRVSDPNAVGIGNLVFVDYDGSGTFEPGEGVGYVTVKLFRSGDDPLVDQAVAVMQTTDEGYYYFGGLTAGSYFVYIPASEFQLDGPLQGMESLPGSGGDFGLDDDFDENGVDAVNPALTGVFSDVIALAPDAEPIDVFGEQGQGTEQDIADDNNSDLTVDLGFYAPVAVGNLVFYDQNGNGVGDVGEGVEGVTVEIFPSGANPHFDENSGAATTDANGFYRITGLAPGDYFLHVSDLEFVGGGALQGAFSVPGVSSGDDDLGEDGIDEPNPTFFGVSTGVFSLAPGTAATGIAESGLAGSSDDDNDSSVDLTFDLGFTGVVSVGNRLFVDTNRNGLDDDNAQLSGALVELFAADGETPVADATGSPVASQLTDGSGFYSFANLLAGTYVVRVTPPTDYLPTTYGGDPDNDVDHDSNAQMVPGNV